MRNMGLRRTHIRGLLTASLALLLASLGAPDAMNRGGVPLVVHAAAGPTITVQPQSGLPGSSVSLSAVGFDPTLGQQGLTAAIVFDTGSPIDTQKLAACTGIPGAAPTLGFGADCTGASVTEQVPAGALPGPQHLFIVRVGDLSPSAPFTVVVAATATPTVTETIALTATVALTPTDTDTPTPTITATPTVPASATSTVASLASPIASSTAVATATPVPSVPPTFRAIGGPLPIYRLVRTAPPLNFMLGQLDRLSPRARIMTIPDQHGTHIVAGYDGTRLVAYADWETGDSAVFPVLPAAGPTMAPIERLTQAAQAVLGTSALIPRDATKSLLAQPLFAGTLASGQRPGTRSTRLIFFPVARRVGVFPVYGPGSRAALVLGPDGSLQGYIRSWRTAVLAGFLLTPRPAGDVLGSIQAQLATVGAGLPVTLDSIALTYYDGNQSYLEPAYRFTASVHAGGVAVDHVIGYEPVAARELEPLPTLGPTIAASSRSADPADRDSDGIARFVVQGPMPAWHQDSLAFQQGVLSFWPRLQGLAGAPGKIGPSSTPAAFTTARNFAAYANTARVLESEAPGGQGHFITDRYTGGAVNVASLGALGGAGGKQAGLAFWVARTPSLIASPEDTTAPYRDWLPVFGGLHAVVGYRTELYANDGVAGPFGADLAMGAPVVSAWLLEGAATSAYRMGENPLYESSSAAVLQAPSGRVSTLSVCRHGGDTLADTGMVPRATCLQSWWLE